MAKTPLNTDFVDPILGGIYRKIYDFNILNTKLAVEDIGDKFFSCNYLLRVIHKSLISDGPLKNLSPLITSNVITTTEQNYSGKYIKSSPKIGLGFSRPDNNSIPKGREDHIPSAYMFKLHACPLDAVHYRFNRTINHDSIDLIRSTDEKYTSDSIAFSKAKQRGLNYLTILKGIVLAALESPSKISQEDRELIISTFDLNDSNKKEGIIKYAKFLWDFIGSLRIYLGLTYDEQNLQGMSARKNLSNSSEFVIMNPSWASFDIYHRLRAKAHSSTKKIGYLYPAADIPTRVIGSHSQLEANWSMSEKTILHYLINEKSDISNLNEELDKYFVGSIDSDDDFIRSVYQYYFKIFYLTTRNEYITRQIGTSLYHKNLFGDNSLFRRDSNLLEDIKNFSRSSIIELMDAFLYTGHSLRNKIIIPFEISQNDTILNTNPLIRVPNSSRGQLFDSITTEMNINPGLLMESQRHAADLDFKWIRFSNDNTHPSDFIGSRIFNYISIVYTPKFDRIGTPADTNNISVAQKLWNYSHDLPGNGFNIIAGGTWHNHFDYLRKDPISKDSKFLPFLNKLALLMANPKNDTLEINDKIFYLGEASYDQIGALGTPNRQSSLYDEDSKFWDFINECLIAYTIPTTFLEPTKKILRLIHDYGSINITFKDFISSKLTSTGDINTSVEDLRKISKAFGLDKNLYNGFNEQVELNYAIRLVGELSEKTIENEKENLGAQVINAVFSITDWLWGIIEFGRRFKIREEAEIKAEEDKWNQYKTTKETLKPSDSDPIDPGNQRGESVGLDGTLVRRRNPQNAQMDFKSCFSNADEFLDVFNTNINPQSINEYILPSVPFDINDPIKDNTGHIIQIGQRNFDRNVELPLFTKIKDFINEPALHSLLDNKISTNTYAPTNRSFREALLRLLVLLQDKTDQYNTDHKTNWNWRINNIVRDTDTTSLHYSGNAIDLNLFDGNAAQNIQSDVSWSDENIRKKYWQIFDLLRAICKYDNLQWGGLWPGNQRGTRTSFDPVHIQNTLYNKGTNSSEANWNSKKPSNQQTVSFDFGKPDPIPTNPGLIKYNIQTHGRLAYQAVGGGQFGTIFANVLKLSSEFEGAFNQINPWDRTGIAIGFIQFNGNGIGRYGRPTANRNALILAQKIKDNNVNGGSELVDLIKNYRYADSTHTTRSINKRARISELLSTDGAIETQIQFAVTGGWFTYMKKAYDDLGIKNVAFLGFLGDLGVNNPSGSRSAYNAAANLSTANRNSTRSLGQIIDSHNFFYDKKRGRKWKKYLEQGIDLIVPPGVR